MTTQKKPRAKAHPRDRMQRLLAQGRPEAASPFGDERAMCASPAQRLPRDPQSKFRKDLP